MITQSLSATGSIILPALVMEFSLRARKPSKKSESIAQAANTMKAFILWPLIVQKNNGDITALDSESKLGKGDTFAPNMAEGISFGFAGFLEDAFRIVLPSVIGWRYPKRHR